MTRPFLALFRGADGRSLARALALVLALGGVFDAFRGASMAAAAGVMCTSGGMAASAPAAPSHGDDASCCVLACGSSQAGTVASLAGASLPAPGEAQFTRPPEPLVAGAPRPAGNISPRGPPLLA